MIGETVVDCLEEAGRPSSIMATAVVSSKSEDDCVKTIPMP